MAKKLLALFTVVCMMATLLAIPSVVQADYTNKWTDSFEEGCGEVVYKSGQEYVSSGDNGLLVSPNAVMGMANWASHLTLEPTMGYDGSGGIHMHADTSKNGEKYRKTYLMTRGVVLGENETAVLRYKVKFLEMESSSGLNEYLFLSGVTSKYAGNYSWQIGVYNSDKAAMRALNTEFGESSTWNLNKWYTFVTAVTGTGATKSTKTYVLNEDNTLKATSTKNIAVNMPADKDPANEETYFWPVCIGEVTLAKKRLVVDDVSLSVVKTDGTQAISFDETGSNIADGEKGIALDKTFRIAFDKDLASTAADTVKLYKKADTEKTSPISCTVSGKAYDSFLLTPAELELNTEYVLDFSGVTSAQGAVIADASKTISFKTVDPGEVPIEPVKFVSAAATSGNFTEGTYSNASLTDTFTLNFDSEILEPTYEMAVKLYKTSDTTKTAIAATLAMADDAKSFTITPKAALSLGTNYTIDFAGVKTSLGGALEGTSSVTFTTIASRSPLYLKDNFEAAATINGSLAGNNYKTSDILSSFSAYTHIADDAGISGKGLRLNNTGAGSATVSIKTRNFDLDESETLFLEHKIKIKSLNATSSQAVYFTLTNSNVLYPNSGHTIFKLLDYGESTAVTDQGQGRSFSYNPNEWYTMVVRIGRNSQSGYLLDKDGNLVLEQNYTMSLGNSVKYEVGSVAANKTEISIDMDDFKAYRVQNEAFAPIDSESTVTNGAADIGTTGDIKLVFNQALAKYTPDVVSAFALYDGSTKLDATILRNGGNEIIITPAQSLNAGRRYTIKVDSALKSLSGKAYGGSAEISFTTKTIYDINAISTTIAIAQDGSIASGEKTIVLDNVGEEVTNPVVVASVYADSRLSDLIGYEVLQPDSLSKGENTLKITFESSYSDAGSVKILVYDSMSNLEPLMKAYKIIK